MPLASTNDTLGDYLLAEDKSQHAVPFRVTAQSARTDQTGSPYVCLNFVPMASTVEN